MEAMRSYSSGAWRTQRPGKRSLTLCRPWRQKKGNNWGAAPIVPLASSKACQSVQWSGVMLSKTVEMKAPGHENQCLDATSPVSS
jgi:hypothetical protein